MLLTPRQPFSFAHTLRFILSPPALLNGRKFEPLLDYFEDGEYRRVVEIIQANTLGSIRRVQVWHNGRPSPGQLAHHRSRVPHALLLEIFTDEGIGTMVVPDATDDNEGGRA